MGWWDHLGILLLVTSLQFSWFRTETMQSTSAFIFCLGSFPWPVTLNNLVNR